MNTVITIWFMSMYCRHVVWIVYNINIKYRGQKIWIGFWYQNELHGQLSHTGFQYGCALKCPAWFDKLEEQNNDFTNKMLNTSVTELCIFMLHHFKCEYIHKYCYFLLEMLFHHFSLSLDLKKKKTLNPQAHPNLDSWPLHNTLLNEDNSTRKCIWKLHLICELVVCKSQSLRQHVNQTLMDQLISIFHRNIESWLKSPVQHFYSQFIALSL